MEKIIKIKRNKIKSKKILPEGKKFIFHGASHYTVSRHGLIMKQNHICPNYKCGYSSRIFGWFNTSKMSHRNSSHSTICPHHNLKLINVGCGVEVPKSGSKKRKAMIIHYSKLKSN